MSRTGLIDPVCEMSEGGVKASLKELHGLVKKTQEHRVAAGTTITNIHRTQEKMKNEAKVSTYFKNKLKTLYQNGIEDARKEAELLQQCLDKINEVKTVKVKTAPLRKSVLFVNDSDIRKPKTAMRRSVLMAMLHQTAHQLPVWKPSFPLEKPSHLCKPPPLCGAMPPEPGHVSKPGEQVCARIKTPEGEEQWILAEVVSYNAHQGKYTVEDIDEEGRSSRESHVLTRRKVSSLPTMKADPTLSPSALHLKGQLVMAIYPQTTCFYRGIINALPNRADSDYSVLFEENSYAEGYSPPLKVPQRYVLPIKEARKKVTKNKHSILLLNNYYCTYKTRHAKFVFFSIISPSFRSTMLAV
ncbi:SAGA-associated factor 29-like isoform X2 [Oscarella lobularis]|uniref:SAGA-associated factor 29-like isoform X2 n=1 Tax=Oscarella lobularis TaxID=121494 RepID=UPI0033139A47